MIRLCFVNGSRLFRISIDHRKISFMESTLGNKPIAIDLDKINSVQIKEILNKEQGKKMKKILDSELLKEIAKLETEEQMAQDFKQDLQRTGWRQFKKTTDGI